MSAQEPTRMNAFIIIGVVASLSLSSAARGAECPKVLPEAPSAAQFVACIKELRKQVVPSGAVMAFDIREGCPQEWRPFSHANGRFIIGASDPATSKLPDDANDEPLEHRVFSQAGGTQRHTLTDKEMPGLSGTIVRAELRGNGTFLWDHPSQSGQTWVRNAEPHNNMPPYFALHYCKKK